MMQGKHNFHSSFFSICYLILLFALIHRGQPNARSNWIFFIPIFILYNYTVFFCTSATTTSNFTTIMSYLHLVPTTSDYILLWNRQPKLRQIGQKKATSKMSFTERLVWAISLLTTTRGIRWAHEPTAHIPWWPRASRKKFIASQFLWIIFYYIIFDIASIHIQENPCFKTGGPSLAAFGWQWHTTGCMYMVILYAVMSGVHIAMSLVSVAIQLYVPWDWPHIFGSPLDMYTVRNFWGYVLTTSWFSHPSRNQTVVSGTRRIARPLQATQTSLQVPSISQKAHSRPTSNSSHHFLSLDSSMLWQNTLSTSISLKGHPFNFSSSKQLPSHSKMRSLLSPHTWDINRKLSD